MASSATFQSTMTAFSYKVSLVVITAKMAAGMLKLNHPNNRSLRTGHVAYLDREITAGRFLANGETIIFDSDGKLIDGQHRLSAVVESGIPIESLVVEGVPSRAYHSIDGGAVRVAGDAIDVKSHKNTVAAVARFLIIYQDGNLSLDRNDKIGNAQIVDFANANPRIAEIVSSIMLDMRAFAGSGFSPTVAAACLFLFENANSGAALEFTKQVIRGIGVQENTTAWQFRKFVMNSKGPRNSLKPVVASACFIKAFNAFVEGRTIKVFRYVPSSEPRPLVNGCRLNPK